MNKILLAILVILFSLNAQALFEVKDAADQTVLEVSNDGLRIFNEGDTLMVISSSEIKAFIDESAKDKALSRSFSVTTSAASGKAGNVDVLEITTDATKMREGGDGDQYTDFSPENIFLGLSAGTSITSGINNVFLGNESGMNNNSGDDNIFIGDSTGFSNTGGIRNLFIGNKAGKNNISGINNLFLGQESGEMNEEGNFNLSLGYLSGKGNVSGSSNTFIGFSSGLESNSSHNTFVGANTGNYCHSGSRNSILGYGAGVFINEGNDNVFLGQQSGVYSTGSSNVIIGSKAGSSLPSGSGNVFLGYQAGSGIGSNCDNNLIIESGYSGSDNYSNALIYGQFDEDKLKFNALVGINAPTSPEYGLTVNGGSSTEYSALFYKGAYAYGDFINGSDKRWKSNIKTIENGLSKVTKLRGVTFDWNRDKYPDKEFSDKKQIGVIAQEIEEIFPELVTIGENGYKGVNYSKMTAVLIEAVKELDEKVNEIELLRSEVEEIKKQLK